MPTYTVTVQQEITVITSSKAAAKAMVEADPPHRHIVGSNGSLKTSKSVKVVKVEKVK